ncbi:MAG: hypothetical protein WC352_02245 [Candidatus Omnitrophota bacterium]|jgi:hypothetical protein
MRPKSDLLSLFAIAVLLALFYPGLVLARQASLMGDHWEQHYPWAWTLADSLHRGQWPFWTPLIQCGFPLAAESQIGIFYLPNLILTLCLPIQPAYAAMNLVHFFVSGAGTYFYSRRIGLRPVAAFVAAVVFVFGTGYGGAYYNLTSLKTLAWFPWILWGFEKFLERFRKRYLCAMAAFMGQAIVAGYLQVAVLMLAICMAVFFLRLFIFADSSMDWRRRLKGSAGVLASLGGAVILALPQLLLSFELALFSNRMNLTEDYAYVGSMAPPVLLTLLFPKLQGLFRGNCLYSGIFTLYFLMAAYFASRKELRRVLWLWTTVSLLALALALGGWSPVYIALIKLSHFYAFRIPAKYLIFICFGVAVLAGLGTHVWCDELVLSKERLRVLNRTYLKFAAAAVALWGIVYFFVTKGRSAVLHLGEWTVEHFIYGKSGHPRSLDEYFSGVSGLADAARDMLAFTNPWQLWALVLILISCLWVMMLERFLKRSRGAKLCLLFALVVLLADFYVFSGEDIKKDIGPFPDGMKKNAAVAMLLAEKGAGRMGRLYGFRKSNENLPVVPSVNMLYGIEDIGGYSPFILGRYFETIGQLGNVNDSNRMMDPETSFVLERLPLLDALGVSHILSSRELLDPSLELLMRDPESGAYLYRNREDHPRGYFVAKEAVFADWKELKEALMGPGFDPRKTLLLEKGENTKISGRPLPGNSAAREVVCARRDPDREVWQVETTGPGFFVLTNTHYPGWSARLNGVEVPLLKAYGLFQALELPAGGKHSIELTYRPLRGLLRKWAGRGDELDAL